MGRFPRKEMWFKCLVCEENHDTVCGAEECCPNEIESVEMWICSVCDQEYEDRDEAYSCCD